MNIIITFAFVYIHAMRNACCDIESACAYFRILRVHLTHRELSTASNPFGAEDDEDEFAGADKERWTETKSSNDAGGWRGLLSE